MYVYIYGLTFSLYHPQGYCQFVQNIRNFKLICYKVFYGQRINSFQGYRAIKMTVTKEVKH